jgi:hypothetical protein
MNFKEWMEAWAARTPDWKSLSEVSSTADKAQSWLSPRGEFHSTEGVTHSEWAWSKGKGPQDFFKNGWIRVTYVGRIIYLHNDVMLPNERQKREIFDFALESGRFDKVVFDDGERERELN